MNDFDVSIFYIKFVQKNNRIVIFHKKPSFVDLPIPFIIFMLDKINPKPFMMNKCIFLDRDGVLNVDRVDYVYRVEDFIIPEGTIEALQKLKNAGYLLIVITNQSGIAKGIYTREDVMKCHRYLQEQCGNILDDIYFSPRSEERRVGKEC